MNLKRVRVFFFDLDGVLSVGKEEPIYLGGREVVAEIKSSGRKALVLTNDSVRTRTAIQEGLTNLGFNFTSRDILTSSYLTARYLTNRLGKSSFYPIGEEGLRKELELAGHTYNDSTPQAVVIGLDRKLTYGKLNSAFGFLKKGAELVGAYGGAVYMSENGPALSAGPIIKALEYASEKRAVIIGKPSPTMFRLALKEVGGKARDAVMIGDQFETDLLGAQRIGVGTILVLTGVEDTQTAKRAKTKPDRVLCNVDELIDLI